MSNSDAPADSVVFTNVAERLNRNLAALDGLPAQKPFAASFAKRFSSSDTGEEPDAIVYTVGRIQLLLAELDAVERGLRDQDSVPKEIWSAGVAHLRRALRGLINNQSVAWQSLQGNFDIGIKTHLAYWTALLPKDEIAVADKDLELCVLS